MYNLKYNFIFRPIIYINGLRIRYLDEVLAFKMKKTKFNTLTLELNNIYLGLIVSKRNKKLTYKSEFNGNSINFSLSGNSNATCKWGYLPIADLGLTVDIYCFDLKYDDYGNFNYYSVRDLYLIFSNNMLIHLRCLFIK